MIGALPVEGGAWPADEVGRILEDIQNQELEEGLSTAIVNRRGYTRGPDEGARKRSASLRTSGRKPTAPETVGPASLRVPRCCGRLPEICMRQ